MSVRAPPATTADALAVHRPGLSTSSKDCIIQGANGVLSLNHDVDIGGPYGITKAKKMANLTTNLRGKLTNGDSYDDLKQNNQILKQRVTQLKETVTGLINEQEDLEKKIEQLTGQAPRTSPELNKMKLTFQVVTAQGEAKGETPCDHYLRADMEPNKEYNVFVVIDGTNDALTDFVNTNLPLSVTLETTRTGADDWTFGPGDIDGLTFNPVDSPNGVSKVHIEYEHPSHNYKYNHSIKLTLNLTTQDYEDLSQKSEANVDVLGQKGRRIYAKVGRIAATHGSMARGAGRSTGPLMLRTYCTHGLFATDPYNVVFTPFEKDSQGSQFYNQRPFFVATVASTVKEQVNTRELRLNNGIPVIYENEVFDETGQAPSRRRATEALESMELLTRLLTQTMSLKNPYMPLPDGSSSSDGC